MLVVINSCNIRKFNHMFREDQPKFNQNFRILQELMNFKKKEKSCLI